MPTLLSTDIWLIFRYIQQTFFNILLKSVRYWIELWWINSWYPFIIPLMSGWYPWYLISDVPICSKVLLFVGKRSFGIGKFLGGFCLCASTVSYFLQRWFLTFFAPDQWRGCVDRVPWTRSVVDPTLWRPRLHDGGVAVGHGHERQPRCSELQVEYGFQRWRATWHPNCTTVFNVTKENECF